MVFTARLRWLVQSIVFAIVVVFLVFFAGMTVSVVVRSGFDIFVGLSVLVLVLIGFGVIGALRKTPPDE